MISALRFPTALHLEVAGLAGDFFSSHAYVDTLLVVNSCARGRAVAGSDLDMAVLITPTTPSQEVQSLTLKWEQFIATQPMVHRFRSTGRFTQVHVDIFDGRMTPTVWDDGGGPDTFEIEIGNRVAYAAPLCVTGIYFRQLQSQWLPYYEEQLRLSRLAMVREACARDLEAVPFFLGRGLYFQAFDRLYKAFHEFLQALFMARRTYPLAYNKWIREQVLNGCRYRTYMKSFHRFSRFEESKVPNLRRTRTRCEFFWSVGLVSKLTVERRPNLALHRMAAPLCHPAIRESRKGCHQ